MIKRLILAALLLCSYESVLYSDDFSEWLGIFKYPEVISRISDMEKQEFSKITSASESLTYPDKKIKLYLIASGVTDSMELAGMISRFESLVSEAKMAMRRDRRLASMNQYNRAEFLLHFLHGKLFKIQMTGAAAGYNTGIRETFDTGEYNCYKSALIYNSFLEYFGYETYYMSVPEHIYSVVKIDGMLIDVETTSRYGFDSYGKGQGQYKRMFDKANIKLESKQYSSKTPTGSVEALAQIYNNRSLIHTGDLKLYNEKAPYDPRLSASLVISGAFLSGYREKYILDRLAYALFLVASENLSSRPELVEKENIRYREILEHRNFKKYSAPHYKNIEIVTGQTLKKIRESETSAGDSISPDPYVKECSAADSLITLNTDIRDVLWNNSIYSYSTELQKQHDLSVLEGIKSYSIKLQALLGQTFFDKSAAISALKKNLIRNVCVRINNLGVALLNSMEIEKARDLFSEGILFLTSELKQYDPGVLKTMEGHLRYAKSLLKEKSG